VNILGNACAGINALRLQGRFYGGGALVQWCNGGGAGWQHVGVGKL